MKLKAKRKSDDWKYRFKVPTTIDEIDYRLWGENGGPEIGECVLLLGDSGAALTETGTTARSGCKYAIYVKDAEKINVAPGPLNFTGVNNT